MDYDLSRLSTRSFEQLVQALAAEVIAPGIVVFGDGPDGGREASFEGVVPYPSIADQWNGTLVVQAKFRQRTQGTAKDTQWALDQLQKELEETFDGSSRRPRPTHYIFATNVSLSSVPEAGGKARAEEIAAGFPLEGFHHWDYDKLRTFLDGAEGVRNAFGAFISSGDVLAELKNRLDQATPDFDALIANFLEKELLADQFANLEQAGRVAEEQIPISRVFVDLPTAAGEEGADANGFIATSLEIAAEKLGPKSEPAAEEKGYARPQRGRLVLVGGPGQGKTTAGQFLCQLFRAGLLESRPPDSLTPEARTALGLMQAQCREEEIPIPTVRRFPIRIALTELADRLAEADGPGSLLEALAAIIARRTGHELPIGVFREWLAEYPWLLVLDGLDEVPASSNRSRIMEAIRDFWVDATQAKADLLVIATTRPQGYNDDFSPSVYRHVALAPLPPDLAERYGERLAQARHPSDSDRQRRIVTRLGQAARNESTAKLMTSPLQVTIMATLVDRGGQPPEQRWKLFSEYYDVIYRRELEREIPAVRVLRDHKPDIDAVHRRVALVLQVEGEHVSHAEARMPTERFAAIVRTRLEDEGHVEPKLTAVEDEIIKAAADRLVFLVGVEADEVGFEIRSLQEFMAGEALMDGSERSIAERLRAIAGVTSWRNVFLFAAGHCFAERQHLRDTVATICAQLNDPAGDPLAPIARPGSLLASDLLADGFARTQPTYSRLLADQAVRLAGRTRQQKRLLKVYEDSLSDIYQEALVSALEDARLRSGAIATLLALDAAGESWAAKALDNAVPRSASGLIELLQAGGNATSDWMLQRAEELGPTLGLGAILTHSSTLSVLSRRQSRNPIAILGAAYHKHWTRMMDDRLDLVGIESRGFEIGLRSLDMPVVGELRTSLEKGDPIAGSHYQAAVEAVLGFDEQPTAAELGRRLKLIADAVDPGDWMAIGRFSAWPLSAPLAEAAQDPEALRRVAALAEAGEMGDTETWQRAERRWREIGVTAEDLNYVPDIDAPYDAGVDVHGFPDHARAGMSRTSGESPAAAAGLVAWLDTCEREVGRSSIAHWLAFALGGGHGEDPPAAPRYCDCMIEQAERDPEFGSLELVASLSWKEEPSDLEGAALDALGRNLHGPRQGASQIESELSAEPLAAQLVQSWNRGEIRSDGVFRLIALGLPPAAAPPAEDDEIAKRNPGAAGLLQLKLATTEGDVTEAIARIGEVHRQEPLWALDADRAIASRFLPPALAELAARTLWDVTDPIVGDDHRAPLLRTGIEALAEDLVDQRATELDQPARRASLDFFPWPEAAAPEASARA